MFGYIDKISSHLHDYCMKAVVFEGQNTNLIVLPCVSFYFQNPIVQILTFFHFLALVKPSNGTGWTTWHNSQAQNQMEILDVELAGMGFAVAGGGTAQHLPFPVSCWANRTVQVQGRRWSQKEVETEKGKYGAVVYCRESLGKTEDNLLGIFEGPPLSGFCGWLQLLRRPGAARQEETPQGWTASPCSKHKLL